MGFIPFSYWGYGCNDFLPTGSLVFYYNANDSNSYDKLFTGSGTNTSTGIINLANQGTNLGIVYNSSYNNTYYGINTLSGRIDNNIPLTLYDGATQGTILVKGYMAPFLNASNKYLLRNPTNSNEGIRAFGTVSTTTKGRFTFSRGVVNDNGVPTGSMYNTEGVGTIAITKQVGQTFPIMLTSADNFSSAYSSSGAPINNFDFIFENLGYFQAAAYWDRKLTTAELISASTAFNCNGQPQGYNATTASSYSNLFRFYGGTSGTTAYYLAPNETTLTRRPIAIDETYYACLSNSGSRLITGGSSVSATDLGPCPTASIYPKVDVLLVAGGGGGGDSNEIAGGGGAGGYLTSSITLSALTTYPIVIGNGGARIQNGENSTAFSLTAIGGGFGGYGSGSFVTGSLGGSGGGGGFLIKTGAPGTTGQGFAGGNSNRVGGGGGGAYEAGEVGSLNTGAGDGGSGNYYYFTSTYYAGGGGGSYSSAGPYNIDLFGAGGIGGGGNGGFYQLDPTAQPPRSGSATNGTPNTGGGGGAGWFYNDGSAPSLAGSGGSGIVIVSYSGSTPQATGGTITSGSGYVIHTFTSSGNFVTL